MWVQKETALHACVVAPKAQVELAQLLIEHKADVSILNSNQETAQAMAGVLLKLESDLVSCGGLMCLPVWEGHVRDHGPLTRCV